MELFGLHSKVALGPWSFALDASIEERPSRAPEDATYRDNRNKNTEPIKATITAGSVTINSKDGLRSTSSS